MSQSLGYTDTPILPDSGFHVHDGNRPQPPIVDPGEPGTQHHTGRPPSDAVVLFGGADLSHWKGRGGPAEWKVEHDYMEVAPGTGDITTVQSFGDIQLHLEWAAPRVVKGDGQGRGNSGIFLAGAYEIQVLDCYDNPTYPDGQATGIYGYMPPQVNASRPPGVWQTYDILCEGPRFKDGKLEKAMIVTVLHNGVVTQNHTALIGETPHLHVGTYHAHPEKGPLKLQDHGNPIRYRNIWIRAMHMPTPEDIGDGPKIGQ